MLDVNHPALRASNSLYMQDYDQNSNNAKKQ